jgi:hypothetical protein
MRVALSLNLDLAKFDQSRLYISMFCSLKFQGKRRMQQATQSGYAEHHNRSHDAVIRVYDDAGNGHE